MQYPALVTDRRDPSLAEPATRTRTAVFVSGTDPLGQAGVAAYLRSCSEITLVEETGIDDADVAFVVGDTLGDAVLRVVRAVQRNGSPKVLLLLTEVDAQAVEAAAQANAVGVLRRAGATPEALRAAVRSVTSGGGVLPPDLVGGLLRRMGRAQPDLPAPRGFPLTGVSDRELRVLRLLSDGCDTREIARTLMYSERTVKNIIQDVTRRFGLRNRSHAVAYALRNGLI